MAWPSVRRWADKAKIENVWTNTKASKYFDLDFSLPKMAKVEIEQNFLNYIL